MRVYVLGTGSAGNALLVEAEGARVLVEGGVGPKALAARLETLGQDLLPRSVDAIVATHHHGDHFGHMGPLARALRAPVFAHRGVDVSSLGENVEVRTYEIGRSFRVGPIEIDSERVPHDAPQVALRLSAYGRAFGLATDVGRVTTGLVGLLARCDSALVEANHCRELLAFGPYPPRVRERVGGGLGHLSNDQTAELAQKLVGSRLGRLWLGHISRSNNDVSRALDVVASAAPRIAVDALPQGTVCALDVATTRSYQLALFDADPAESGRPPFSGTGTGTGAGPGTGTG